MTEAVIEKLLPLWYLYIYLLNTYLFLAVLGLHC